MAGAPTAGRRWPRLAAALLAAGARGRYVALTGARCREMQGEYPIGEAGAQWQDELLEAAYAVCDAAEDCLGVMRYTGSVEAHCRDWCGRPQFCVFDPGVGEGGGLSLNLAWTSYVKAELLPALGLPAPRDVEAPPAVWGPSGGEAAALRRGELLRQVSCEELTAGVWRGPPVVLLAPGAGAPFPGACQVAHQPFAGPRVGGEGLDGLLVEAPEEDLPIFSASLRPRVPGASAAGPWRYYFDAVAELPVYGLGMATKKQHILSIYFLTQESSCPGAEGAPRLTPARAAESLGWEHVYVEDGTHELRERAFRAYSFAVLCGDFEAEPFPPQALVYSVAFVTYALVPEYLHWRSSRLFFHLPDAAQGYRTIDVLGLAPYLEDMLTSPAKENVQEFKQTFALLSQQLLWYRFREPAGVRAEVAACALCDARHRERLRSEAAGSGDDPRAVAVAFCGMSRRSAHGLRDVVRETWGRFVAEAAPFAAQRFFVGLAGDQTQALVDAGRGDVVELPVVESYRTLNLKAFSMLSWTFHAFPNLQWVVRHDDDVYLRASALMAQLAARPPVRYFWGMFDHGSAPVRDPAHQHYNSYEQFPEQQHPAWGDIFPPYARGLLWAMSVDLLALIVSEFLQDIDTRQGEPLDEAAASQIPHPDDPAVGVVVTSLVRRGLAVNLDDRDFNSFSLNPSCNSTFSNIHTKTWVVHHVRPETMRCMWELDSADGADTVSSSNSATDASQRSFPDLCLCSTPVVEEEFDDPDGAPFWYDRTRFNSAR